MSENAQEKKSSQKLVVILLIVLILLVIGGVITAVILLNRNDEDDSIDGGEPAVTIGYEGNGVVALSPDEVQELLDRMRQEAEEGMVDLSFKNTAVSEDGVHFECQLGNSPSNKYDEYFQIFINGDPEQQVLLTGLVPPGSELSEFESEIQFEPGEYSSTLVITQIEDDHATIHGQAMVVLHLLVVNETEFDDSIFD